jgi:hypothetical protein
MGADAPMSSVAGRSAGILLFRDHILITNGGSMANRMEKSAVRLSMNGVANKHYSQHE